MSISKNPALNLKAVLQETGIAADTLRAWERRYGLPLPQRTAGGHRLYSQYDVETIKWLIARQADGLSISRAVDLWNEHHASGADPLAGLSPSTVTSALAIAANTSADTTLDSLRNQWVTACLNFNEASSEQILNQAFSIFPVESVCLEVLQKGLVEIGGLWYQNQASVQQEHFASALAMRRLDALLSASPTPSRPQTMLVGCPPGEWHTFTPLLISLFLRRRGFNVVYLGANVPAERFEETITTVKADLVILVAQTLISAASLQSTAIALSNQKTPIGFGGRIFKEQNTMAEYLPGHYLGDVIETSMEQIEKIIKTKSKPKDSKIVSQQYIAALQAFNSRRSHIETTVKEKIPSLAINPDEITTGIQFLGDNIIAALQFGDMELLTNEIEWLKTLLQTHERSPQELAGFMEIYSNAVDTHINGQGQPIKAWLNAQAHKA